MHAEWPTEPIARAARLRAAQLSLSERPVRGGEDGAARLVPATATASWGLIVGASWSHTAADWDAGGATWSSERPAPLPLISLRLLRGPGGFADNGAVSGDYSGNSVSSAGDVETAARASR